MSAEERVALSGAVVTYRVGASPAGYASLLEQTERTDRIIRLSVSRVFVVEPTHSDKNSCMEDLKVKNDEMR
jgi:hypothetical protein